MTNEQIETVVSDVDKIMLTNIVNASVTNDEFEKLTTKSAKIRFLHSSGMSKGDISRKLGSRYQHVRNVLITPIKKS